MAEPAFIEEDDNLASLRQLGIDELADLRELGQERSGYQDFREGSRAQVYNTGQAFIEMMTGTPLPRREIPDTMGGRMGAVGVEAAAFAVPIGAATTRVGRASQEAGKMRTIFQNAMNEMGVRFQANPYRSTAIEGGLGMTAGAGGFYAEEQYPDSLAARFVGEVLGGTAPQAVGPGIKALGSGALWAAERIPGFTGRTIRSVAEGGRELTRRGGELIENVERSLAPDGGRYRSSERIERATPDRLGALASMNEDLLDGLTPAAQTGDRGLLALEASVDATLDDRDKFIQRSIDNVNKNINIAINQFGGLGGASADTAATFRLAQEELSNLLDERVKQAARRTEQTLEQIAPGASREVTNRTAYLELDKALTDMRKQETKLFKLIGGDAPAPTSNTTEAYASWVGDLSKAEIDQIPAKAKKFLAPTITSPDGKRIPNPNYYGTVTDVRELRGLQSTLREYARIEGGRGRGKTALIASDIANAITEDIANVTEAGVADAVDTAVNFSRDLNRRFTQGTVGDVLGYSVTGGAKVDPSIVLERTLGNTASRGAIARSKYDDLANATQSPEFVAATEDYIKNLFFDNAVTDGQLNVQKAQTFLKNNNELMNRFPSVYADIQNAIRFGDTQALRMAQAGRVSIDNPHVSRATLFIRKGPEQAFNTIRFAQDPALEIKNLVNMAGRDPTGKALMGLQSSFADYIRKNSMQKGNFSQLKMESFFKSRGVDGIMNALYSAPERARWGTIRRTIRKLDLQRAASASGEGVLGDKPGENLSILARVLGAWSGRNLGRMTGAGGTVQIPGMFATRAQKMLERGMDPAQKLITDSVTDEGLFRILVGTKIDSDGRIPDAARRRIQAWAVASFGPEVSDEEEQ